MNISEFDDNIHTEFFNGKGYKFNAVLFNGDGQVLRLRLGAIDELFLEDDLLHWVHKGHITINNPHNALERTDRIYTDAGTHETINFHFRSDGRDFLYLFIEPLVDSNELTDINSDIYTIKLIFSIYKIDEIQDGDPGNKRKRLYFHDYRYQHLLEKNARWSTTSIIKAKNEDAIPSQLSNKERSVKCGEAIKELLKFSLESDFNDITFSPNWNNGSNSIFYSSPNEYKVVDDLEYILKDIAGIGETGEYPCILRLERTLSHEWSLMSLCDYFNLATNGKKGGPFQSERFHLSYMPDESTPIPNRPKAPVDRTTSNNIHIPGVSEINDFEFSQQPAWMNQEKITSTAVNIYDHSKKEFIVQQYNIEDIETDFQEKIAEKMFSSGDSKPTSNMFINSMKRDNVNMQSVNGYGVDVDTSKAYGIGTVAFNNVFTNNAIKFSCIGNTNRQSGRFIGIDRSNSYDENTFDSKLLGQYFTVSVTHIFSSNKYINEIIGVKPYSSNKINYNEQLT